MPATSAEIAATTRAYLERHPGELGRLQPLLDLLATAPDPASRATLPAHVTCSGVVVDRDLRVLHVHHRATGLVLCPGGHGEATDETLLATAIREVAEEAGIPPGALCLAPHLLDAPVDIDVNAIDANPDKNEGAHQHYDFRFVFYLADGEPPPVRLQQEEVTGAEWRPLVEVSSPDLRAKLLGADLTGVPVPGNASAVIHNGRGQYLLHLRDNHPHIWAPGEWSLLGGGREAGDATIEATLRRELAEEVPGIDLGAVEPLTVEWTTDRHGLAVPIQIFTARWDGHPDTAGLREGVLVHWVCPEDLHRLHLRDSTRRLLQEHAASRTAARPPAPRTPPATGQVRRAVATDADELARLRLVMLHSADVATPPGWEKTCAAWFRERLTGQRGFAAFVVDGGAGVLVSCAVAQYDHCLPRPGRAPFSGVIASVATDPAHRRRGHARRVVAAARQWLAEVGCGQVRLTASPDGERLYRDLGFTDPDPAGPIPLAWSAP
ncbi:NUDIX hydrolase [Kitasatospora cheerisanensis]|uniref:NUDIX hydrolase n=1 Tax=Kitasatospora cheerisanensis KCTC 2395 TaxID=1348663 RepID=A0A066YSY9_9ACTN|nr:NUDIX hydrolase [Kitasatospora cheerisanensis]KDN81050.1 NUDIX hydrolase [Kitasatospora cheerisanensis KCTC 2395]